jgi:hypothetical protein
MCLFPSKYCYQTHIQSQLFQRQKMIFYSDKLIYTQNLKFYLNNFTELRNDLFSLRYLRLNHRSITVFLLNKPMGLFPSIYGKLADNIPAHVGLIQVMINTILCRYLAGQF